MTDYNYTCIYCQLIRFYGQRKDCEIAVNTWKMNFYHGFAHFNQVIQYMFLIDSLENNWKMNSYFVTNVIELSRKHPSSLYSLINWCLKMLLLDKPPDIFEIKWSEKTSLEMEGDHVSLIVRVYIPFHFRPTLSRFENTSGNGKTSGKFIFYILGGKVVFLSNRIQNSQYSNLEKLFLRQ